MQNATWFGIGTFGSLTVGSTVRTSVSFFDPNGNSDGIVHTGYIIEEPIGFGFSSRTVVSDPSNPSDSIRILPEWAGKTLLVGKGFFDDTNVLEERTFTVGQIPAGSASTNTAPVAGNDTATATAGQSVTINIGANDSDADSDRLTITGVTNPTKGTVSYTDNFSSADTVRYTPFSTSTGTDSFMYQVSDGNGGTDTATVTITISSANRDPVALNDTAMATAGQAVTISIGANDSDADGDRLTTNGVTLPSKGTVSYRDNFSTSDTVTYTPSSTATGTDSFIYRVSDGKGGTDTATVTVTISAPDQSADTSTTGRISIAESVIGELSLSPFDPDDWFAIRLLGSKNYIFNLEGSPTGKGTATDTFLALYGPTGNFIQENDNSGVGLNARLSYTPQDTGTYYIAARFTLLNDGDFGEGTGLGTYTLSAALNNRNPVAENDTATVRNGQPVTINVGANDSDADRDNLTTTGLTNPTKGTVRYTDNSTTSDTVTYTPFSTATGTDSFTYQISDGNGGTDSATVTVSIGGTIQGDSDITLPIHNSTNLTASGTPDFLVGTSRNDTFIFHPFLTL